MKDANPTRRLVQRHLALGWWGLAVFIGLGMALETLHAIKSPFYLDAGHETTRLLFRLAHAHGTGLSLVNILFALTGRVRPRSLTHFASSALVAAYVLLPLGFFLGGLGAQRGDPGRGILLVPAGAALLLAAVVAIARRIGEPEPDEDDKLGPE